MKLADPFVGILGQTAGDPWWLPWLGLACTSLTILALAPVFMPPLRRIAERVRSRF